MPYYKPADTLTRYLFCPTSLPASKSKLPYILKKASSSTSTNHSENHTNHGPFQNSLSKSEISLPLDPDLVRHLPFGNLRVQEEIALVSNVPLTQPRSDLAHNYPVLEEEQLQRISSANDRIMNQIVYYEELRRMKLHFLEVLLQQ